MGREIIITGISSKLEGVGRAGDGRVLFVKGALPGERVIVDVKESSERFVHADLLEIAEPSPHRTLPACPHYAVCGGCQAQHMSYEESLRLKRWAVVDALERIGGLADPSVLDTLPSNPNIRYRNKAEYAIADGKIGFFKGDSRKIVEVEDCILQHPVSVAAMKTLRRFLAKNQFKGLKYLVTRVNPEGRMMLALSHEGMPEDVRPFIRELPDAAGISLCRLKKHHTHALDGELRRSAGETILDFALSGLTFALSMQSFFQVNTRQAEQLYACALEFTGLKGDETVIDAYSGVGTVALIMAREAKHVIGVEIVPEAVNDATQNAARNNLADKAVFLHGAAEKMIPQIVGTSRIDVVAFDPPRRGLDPSLIDACVVARPDKIVYISCNPATLARDIKRFVQSGAYRHEKTRPVDMFPWTAHVECVALLSKK